MKLKITILFSIFSILLQAQPAASDIDRVLSELNLLRSNGCKCGSKWMPPVGPLKWDMRLHEVSSRYAKYLAKNRHFDHVSLEGEDLGDRLDEIGYDWTKIGENLAYGYNDFYSVLDAWKDSPSHCRMLLDPDVTRIGMSKHKIYWVQSFSRSGPPAATYSSN